MGESETLVTQAAAAGPEPFELVIVTGMSGSGKSLAANCFEDLGYVVMDNLPLPLLRQLVRDPEGSLAGRRNVAVVTDTRTPRFADELPGLVDSVDRDRFRLTLLYLDSSDDVLARRYSESRRPHPLDPSLPLPQAIQREREMLAPLRQRADLVFDTGDWTVHELRSKVYNAFATYARGGPGMNITLTSFGFKYGVPRGCDLLFDVRFLPNPHFVDGLRPLTGCDRPVREYLEAEDEYREMIDRLSDLLLYLLPRYQSENRSYLAVAVGCTGGRHRSVAIVEQLGERLQAAGFEAERQHRDIKR